MILTRVYLCYILAVIKVIEECKSLRYLIDYSVICADTELAVGVVTPGPYAAVLLEDNGVHLAGSCHRRYDTVFIYCGYEVNYSLIVVGVRVNRSCNNYLCKTGVVAACYRNASFIIIESRSCDGGVLALGISYLTVIVEVNKEVEVVSLGYVKLNRLAYVNGYFVLS